MALFGALNYLLGLETSGWTKGANTAGKDLDRLKDKTSGFIKDLKSSFGKGSLLGQSLKIAAGGGAIAALSMAGKELTEMASKIHAIRNEMGETTKSGSEIAIAIGESIPVLGSFVSAGKEIGDLLADEVYHYTAMNKVIAEEKKLHQDILDIKKQAAKADADAMEKLGHDQRKLREAKSQPGLERELIRINDDAADEIDSAQKDYKGTFDVKKMEAEAAEIERLKKKIAVAGDSEEGTNAKNQLTIRQHNLKMMQDEEARQAKILEERINVIRETGFTKAQEARKKDADEKQKERDEEAKKVAEALQQNIDHNIAIGKKLTEQAQTPLQKFLAEMKEIDIAQQVGVIDQGVHDALEGKYSEEFEKYGMQKGLGKYTAPTEQHTGSYAGLNITNQANDPVRGLSETAKQQLKEQRKANTLTEKQIEAYKNGSFVLSF